MRSKETRNKHLTLRYIVLRKTKKQPEAVDILASRYGLEYQTILPVVIKTKKKWRTDNDKRSEFQNPLQQQRKYNKRDKSRKQ